MKINGNEIRPGNVIEHKGALWVAVKTQAVKPGKGPAYAQVELKNAIDGTKLNERFRSSETVERVRLGAEGLPVPVRRRRHAHLHGHRIPTTRSRSRATSWRSAPPFSRTA